MQSNAKDETTYIEEAPAESRDALLKLRELCQKYLTGFTENMEYGGPTYSRNGKVTGTGLLIQFDNVGA